MCSDEIKYPSGQILLDIAKIEYENENNRTSILDSKTNTVISLTAIFFVAMAQIINLKKILNFKIFVMQDALIPSILIITIFGALILAFISLIYFLKVIFTKSYFTIDANYFYDIEKLKHNPDYFSIAA